MKIQEAINSGKKVRRKSWVNPNFKEFDLWSDIDSTDILADDWEVEEKVDTEIVLKDEDGELRVEMDDDGIFFETMLQSERGFPVIIQELDLDILLTFLYNNTEIGKKRIVPF